MLHPHQRVSEVQRRQMTTVPGENVFNLAVEGNFDDCQRMIKAAFSDQSFLPDDRQACCRQLDQLGAHPHADRLLFCGGAQARRSGRTIIFFGATGNFGDIYAGYLAKQMGLPVDRMVATNQNDILHRFVSNNETGRAVEQDLFADHGHSGFQ